MKKGILSALMLLACITVFSTSTKVLAHCEIPCGIYDDATRMTLIFEHIATIEKSMNQIIELEKSGTNANQLVRWITNKEKHAEFLQEIVYQYFLTQRIKFDTEKYESKLKALHKLLVYSMKCKQTTDLNNVENLKAAAREFHDLYFGKEAHSG